MIIVRGYAGRALLFQETVDVHSLKDEGMRELVMEQLARVLPFPKHMIEIEFLDEKPKDGLRFFRFGTDTSRMVDPVESDSILNSWIDRGGNET